MSNEDSCDKLTLFSGEHISQNSRQGLRIIVQMNTTHGGIYTQTKKNMYSDEGWYI